MSTKLKLKIGKNPNPDAPLSAKEIRVTKRMLRAIFGTTTPLHKMAILLPGSDTTNVEVQITEPDDDLMALADALDGRSGGGGR
ncbi:hypothetical protein I4J32_03250 [Corynebacterium diphtheriae bv. mitis]|uniref:hypothetical protein n=1 Tax=Corynebacterium diphtheriae TaxID=1717 RepID=UPI0013CB5165|nr:hypothetical protein [Corynebacterium diphtheriae]MBG9312227.1 hypothetical protein [Corynebacterium diphtheriae bv. mitis]CAB0673326.1 hypothetical protein FRC0024_00075 [Corynebacterium diphtheriae]CAB0713489.1 hypothetical protein FRC0032_02096 [Corynebacterium diphtheriae]CAB0740070.1 hypothetical protein FRC0101_02066 [Corynebacterium diphtheriae]CAB0761341.1 hypothetical protein FRC0114_02065 [Corynebacterium diphtheriae]